jgi:hypothetical protein
MPLQEIMPNWAIAFTKGNWNGKQILDSTYIQKMITPTQLSGGIYGLGIWVNKMQSINIINFGDLPAN